MKKLYIGILKDEQSIGHTHLLDEDQVGECIAEIEEEGYSFIMLDVNKLFDPETESISDIIYDWR